MKENYSTGLLIEWKTLRGLGECKDKTLVIPEGIERISDEFASSEGVSLIEKIVFPSTIKKISDNALKSCIALTSLTFKDNDVYWRVPKMFENMPNSLEFILSPSVTFIHYNCFQDFKNLRRIVIPESVERIPECAFSGCANLEEIVIPVSITKIGYEAFLGCNKLVEKEGGVYYVGNWAVLADRSITEATLREGTIGIAQLAFLRCEKLKSIALPESLRYICSGAFEKCHSLESLDLPKDFINIEKQALYDCYSLRRLTIPNVGDNGIGKLFGGELTGGGENERFTPRSLETVILTNCTELPNKAFFACSYIKNVILPDGITSIGESAFMYCESITEITIPESVTEIGRHAFFECKRLTKVQWPSKLPHIGYEAFILTPIEIEE